MKTIVKNYTFNAAAKTITLTDIATVRLDKLALITDTTTNKILYCFADSTVTTATVATNVVTLAALQGGEANGDKLRIDYDVESSDTSAFADATTPVSNASLPLPSGASTSAKQDTGNTSIASVDTKTPALGQALAAASVPVILPAATITTLTPPAAITGFATSAKQDTLLTELQLKADLTETQPVSGTVTANAGTNLNTSALALEAGGNLAAIKAKTDNIPAQGQALAAASTPVVLTAAQITTLTPPAAIAGFATSAKQDTLLTELQLKADLTETQPVSAVSLPLPSGASTAAAQATMETDVEGINTRLGEVQASPTANTLLDRVKALLTELQLKADLTETQPVSLASVPSHAVTNAGVFATQAVAAGDVAHDAADSGNPVKIGGKAVNADPTAVTANDRVNALFDLLGKQVVSPYSIPESMVSGAITSAMTGTTSTSLVAAPAAGLRNYLTTIIVSNAHATVGTDIVIQDGSGGTTLLTIPAAAVYGGAVITLPTPLRQPTTATAIFCANVTTGASTKVSAVGYKGI